VQYIGSKLAARHFSLRVYLYGSRVHSQNHKIKQLGIVTKVILGFDGGYLLLLILFLGSLHNETVDSTADVSEARATSGFMVEVG
jgi:hypothetical protein